MRPVTTAGTAFNVVTPAYKKLHYKHLIVFSKMKKQMKMMTTKNQGVRRGTVFVMSFMEKTKGSSAGLLEIFTITV